MQCAIHCYRANSDHSCFFCSGWFNWFLEVSISWLKLFCMWADSNSTLLSSALVLLHRCATRDFGSEINFKTFYLQSFGFIQNQVGFNILFLNWIYLKKKLKKTVGRIVEEEINTVIEVTKFSLDLKLDDISFSKLLEMGFGNQHEGKALNASVKKLMTVRKSIVHLNRKLTNNPLLEGLQKWSDLEIIQNSAWRWIWTNRNIGSHRDQSAKICNTNWISF